MRPVSIDTNVMLRILLEDDAAQHQAAVRLVKEAGRVFIGSVVLAEVVWALRKIYRWGKEDLIRFITYALDTETFEFENRAAVESALFAFAGGPAGYSDYLIMATALEHGAEPFYTFDAQLAKDERAVKLNPRSRSPKGRH